MLWCSFCKIFIVFLLTLIEMTNCSITAWFLPTYVVKLSNKFTVGNFGTSDYLHMYIRYWEALKIYKNFMKKISN